MHTERTLRTALLFASALQEREAHQLMGQLNELLMALQRTTPDVTVETALAESSSDLAGTVLVKFISYRADTNNRPEADADGSRSARRMNKAWQDMVQIAAQLLSSSGGEAPRLALVHTDASCSTRLALCRRRTTSKLLRRSGKVHDTASYAIRKQASVLPLFRLLCCHPRPLLIM